MLEIKLLGSPEILLDGNPVKLSRRKSRALIYWIAANDHAVPRERLLSFFWADTPRPSAQQVLRTSLHGLRKALGPALHAENEDVSLAGDVWVDARVFENSLSQPDPDKKTLSSILHLYRGDFLSDFFLSDSTSFDDWVSTERERYRQLAVRGLVKLSRLDEIAGDYAAALASLERALAFDALQEDLQREVIRLLYLSGDRPSAIRRYDNLRKLLDEELGVPPMLETRSIYDAILNDTLAPAQQPAQSPLVSIKTKPAQSSKLQPQPVRIISLPFTGRKEELEKLLSLKAVHKLALIEGEAGIGKTRLVQEYIHLSGSLALTGTAHELEHALPYQPVIEALRSLLTHPDWALLSTKLALSRIWLAEVSRLVPELSPEDAAEKSGKTAEVDESRLWEGVHQLLAAAARQRPVVLFLDDLQWADASTLALLGYLIRQAASPVVYIAASQPVSPREPLSALLQTLARSDRIMRIQLKRFTPDEVHAIARHISSVYAYPLSGWLNRLSEGNPFVLAELVRYGREHQVIDAKGTVNLSSLADPPVVPQNVYSLVQARLSTLSETAWRLINAGIAIGREFEFDVAYRAAGLSEPAALDAIDELQAAGLIAPAGEGKDGLPSGLVFAFDHTLTMEVAYREVGEPRRRLMHRRVAEALEQVYRRHTDAVAGLIASHYFEGNAPEQAIPYAIRAGELAANLAAWKEAVRFYEQALDSITDRKTRRKVLSALGNACFRAGEFVKASESFRALLDYTDPGSEEADEARLSLAQSVLPQARYAEAIQLVKDVDAKENKKNASQVQFLWGTILSLEGEDLDEAAEHLRQAAEICAARQDPSQLAEIEFESGSVAAQQGNLPRAIELYRKSLQYAEAALARDENSPAFFRLILAYNNLAYHSHLAGDPAAAGYAQEGLRLAREKGILTSQTYLLSTLGEISLASGDVEAAEAYFSEGLALAEKVRMPERVAGLTANLGLAAQKRGQFDLAIYRLSTALAQADLLGTRHLAAQIRIWLAPLLPPAEARLRLAEARAIAESGGRQRLLADIERLEKDSK
ncbi:MAG: ATP-binding protein [Omnitrophica WOR_2 bacterium]